MRERAGRRLGRFRRRFLEAVAKDRANVFFIAIGANDAAAGDPVRDHVDRHGWRGVYVEPVPYLFDRLKKNLRDAANVRCERLAISDRRGSTIFYSIAPDLSGTLPPYYDHLGSFHRNVILSHANLIPDIESRIVEIDVECETVSGLLERTGNPAVDILQVDTEGHDAAILRSIDFGRFRPPVILYELKHLSREDRRETRQLLQSNGYAIAQDDADAVALNRRAIRSLPRAAARMMFRSPFLRFAY
jgi:FkbM family methyltransferase